MMSDSEQAERVEIYKLHVELADRVSRRREGANRLYVSLLVGLMVFLGALLRFGANDAPVRIILSAAGGIGVLLSISWYVVIRSYRQLNSGKFKALHELEQSLAYPFFKREWELLAQGGDWRRYWRLTTVEIALPIIFFVLFGGLVVVSLLVS